MSDEAKYYTVTLSVSMISPMTGNISSFLVTYFIAEDPIVYFAKKQARVMQDAKKRNVWGTSQILEDCVDYAISFFAEISESQYRTALEISENNRR